MFYSQFILAKKGPLGTIWIAAHLERKLRKNQVADTDIGVSVDSILSPDVPIALRLSSHLLLGVVRIYSRKVNYLFDDCSEALLKVKQAFCSAAVDLPPEQSKAPYHSITLPETFDLDDFELPDNDIFHGNFVDHHISSRDQITLQDTLDGVTYSTSKFGLDERFGDGDASGLDLDEELFLDKVGDAGLMNERSDPQASVGPMTPLKQDEHPEIRNVNTRTMVGDADNYADLVEYAQAPGTPGLVEEPTLSNVQDVSACDDHMESEYPIRESTMIENAKNNIYRDKQEVDWSSHNNKSCDAVHTVLPEEYGHHSDGFNNDSSKPQAESPHETNAEHVPIETFSGSKSPSVNIDPNKFVNSSLEMADNTIGGPQILSIEGLRNGDADEMNSALPIDESYRPPFDTSFEEKACEISGVACNCQRDESFPQNCETQVSNEQEDPSSSNLDFHEKVAASENPFIRPCNSNIEQPDFISGGDMPADTAERSDVTDLVTSGREEMVMIDNIHLGAGNPEEVSKENHMQEHALQEGIDVAFNKPDRQIIADAHDDLVDTLNNSAEVDLPAPEKLLSVPEDFVDQHTNMFAEISPGELVGLDSSDAGSKVISGKKRSFTESTLTEQSLNSVESSRLVRFKRTIESVPDDDDLLSSILVGRSSSVLKVKPTPRPPEMASTKRTRSIQRTPKRKVLMDDTMVLHGDMIRQQLTNVADIRRVRKKAPCTQSEISMIQKQYLDDEFVLKPLFTGMSIELVTLHSGIWNLSGIHVCNDDLNDFSLENVAHLRLPSEKVLPEIGKEASSETTAPISCPVVADNDYSLTTTAEPHSTSQNAENCGSIDVENDKVSGNHHAEEHNGVRITNELLLGRDIEMAKSIECPVPADNGVIEVCEKNVEFDTCNEQTKSNGDAKVNALEHEPLLDLSGLETSDNNNDASRLLASVVQMNSTSEICEELTFANADTSAGLTNQERNALSVELHTDAMTDAYNGQAVEDVLIARDGDVNSAFETEPLVRDDVSMEVAQESATAELLSYSKQGELEVDDHNEMHSAILGENIEYSSYTAQQDYGFMENDRSPEQLEANCHYMMGATSSGFDMHDQEEWKYSAAEYDTGFLNVDDDELNEMADDHHFADEEEAEFIENTGWSSRTRYMPRRTNIEYNQDRAVSKYLQTLFVKEAEQGRKSLSLENQLVGKSRKEASRMFFETLVLKTRDYIHVEQQNPFEGIILKPRTRLMKSVF